MSVLDIPPSIPDLRDICGILLNVGDIVTADLGDSRIEGKIDSNYVIDEKRIFTIIDAFGKEYFFEAGNKNISLYLEKFNRNYRFN